MYSVHVDISNSCYWYWIISIPATWTRKKHTRCTCSSSPLREAQHGPHNSRAWTPSFAKSGWLRLCWKSQRWPNYHKKRDFRLEVWITTLMSTFFASWYMAFWWDFLDFATWSRDPHPICKWGTDCMLATGVFCGHNHFKQNTQFTALSHPHLADTPPDSPSGVKVVRP